MAYGFALSGLENFFDLTRLSASRHMGLRSFHDFDVEPNNCFVECSKYWSESEVMGFGSGLTNNDQAEETPWTLR